MNLVVIVMTELTLNSFPNSKFGLNSEIIKYIFITFIFYAYLIAACYLVDATQMFVVPHFKPFFRVWAFYVLISAQNVLCNY